MQENGGSGIEKKTQPHMYFILYNKQQGIFNVSSTIIFQGSLKSVGRLGYFVLSEHSDSVGAAVGTIQ